MGPNKCLWPLRVLSSSTSFRPCRPLNPSMRALEAAILPVMILLGLIQQYSLASIVARRLNRLKKMNRFRRATSLRTLIIKCPCPLSHTIIVKLRIIGHTMSQSTFMNQYPSGTSLHINSLCLILFGIIGPLRKKVGATGAIKTALN